MTLLKREITEDIYNRAKENRGYLTGEDERTVFSIGELCGYGVYSAKAIQENDKYYVSFYLGSSCD